MVHLRENELPILIECSFGHAKHQRLCNLTDREKITSWLRLVIRLV